MTSENQTYIFIDFDGVCTACDATPGSYITNRSYNYGASKKCVQLLLDLLSDTNAKAIVSSNWRKFEPNGVWHTRRFGDIKNPLPKLIATLGQFYGGIIPPVRHIPKSGAVKLWFDENRIDPKKCNYVIFDDDECEGFGESEFAGHFILVNAAHGLTTKDCDRAKEILRR